MQYIAFILSDKYNATDRQGLRCGGLTRQSLQNGIDIKLRGNSHRKQQRLRARTRTAAQGKHRSPRPGRAAHGRPPEGKVKLRGFVGADKEGLRGGGGRIDIGTEGHPAQEGTNGGIVQVSTIRTVLPVGGGSPQSSDAAGRDVTQLREQAEDAQRSHPGPK